MATNAEINIKQLVDYNLFGGFDTKGNVKKLTGKEAFINGFKMWLLSKEGDYIRDPERGGFLYNWLTKPLSEFNRKRILLSLKTGIENEFVPQMIVQRLDVTPNYNQRTWTISLEAFLPEIKEYINFTEDFKSLT